MVAVADGDQAWDILQRDDAPSLAILDWMMPGVEGPDICRRVRELARPCPTYLMLLTARGGTDDQVVGLDSGADDYVAKPFDQQELMSRFRVGQRMVAL